MFAHSGDNRDELVVRVSDMTAAKTQAGHALAMALDLARRGWSLTPVTIRRDPGTGKKRAQFHRAWRHEGGWSCDPEQVRAWWVDHPDTSFAIGGAANGIEGVDLDVKAAEGIDAVAWWNEQGLPGSPYVQTTPSGGLHLIWRADYDGRTLPQEAGKTLGRGVDVRNRSGLFFAAGGYVVGEEGHYGTLAELIGPADLPTTPDAVLDLFADAAQRERIERPADGRIVTHDLQWQREQVTAALADILGHDREAGGYRAKLQHAGLMYGRVIEQGITDRRTAVERILDAHRTVWGQALWPENLKTINDALDDGPRLERWRVPAETTELRAGTGATAEEASRRTSPLAGGTTINVDLVNEPTAKLITDVAGHSVVQEWLSTQSDALVAENGLGDGGLTAERAVQLETEQIARMVLTAERRALVNRLVAERARPPAPSIAEHVLSFDDLADVEPPAMRVEGLLATGSVSFLAGRSGSYKSFLGVAIVCAIATGTAVAGHGEWSVNGRRRSLYVAAEGPAGVAQRIRAYAHHHELAHLLPGWLSVYPRRVDLTSDGAVEDLRAYVEANDIGFVVYDTWRKMTPGVEENDATPASEVLSRLDALRDDLDVEALIVDHTGHAGERIRGASSKGDDADCVLLVDMPDRDRSANTQRRLVVDKLKDEPTGASWPIRLAPVEAITNRRGVPSAVVEVGETLAVEWGDGDLSDLWQTAELPADVQERIVAGGKVGDLSAVTRIMRTYATGALGLSRADVYRQLKAHDGGVRKDEAIRKGVARGWDLLVELKRIQTVSPTAGAGTASRWIEDLTGY